jgi:hypothetical protein
MSLIHPRSIFFIGLVFSLSACATAQESGRRAWIESLSGTVKVRHAGSTTWLDAKPNMPLKQKDALRTYVESEVVVATSEGSRMAMSENSTFEMSLFSNDSTGQTTRTKLTIFNGSIMSDVKKLVTKESQFEFETPTATATIRGTRVGFDVTSEKTDVKVYEGSVFVAVKGTRTGAEVQSLQMTTVARGQRRLVVQEFKPQPGSESGMIAPDTTHGRGDTASGQTRPGAADTTAPPIVKDTSAPSLAPRPTLISKDTVSQAPRPDSTAARAILVLRVITPGDNQVVTVPLIHVSGTVTPGAEVVIAGAKVGVGATGGFSKDIPIANEEGAVSIEVEAVLGAKQQVVRRSVTYTPPREAISLDVKTPVDKQVVCGRLVPVSGTVRPQEGAELLVNGRKLIVRGGSFNDIVELPDEPGEHEIEFDVTTDDGSQTLLRMVRYAPAQDRACNQQPPQVAPLSIPPTSAQNRIIFSVLDATVHDEVTFFTEIDGSAESETGQPGAQFTLTLEPGEHQYRVYAEDMVKNRSNIVQGRCAFLSQALTIRMRKPMGSNEVVYLPPAGRPGEDAFAPEYGMEFTIENLPGDDYSLLKEVSVINSQGGGPAAQTRFTDVDFVFDVALKRGRNDLTIRVQDDLDRVITRNVTIEVK